jgi:hypothetical protein
MRRQIDIGSVLTRVFQTYGNRAGLILPLAAIVALIAAVLDALANEGFNSILSALVRLLVDSAAAMIFAGLVVEIVRRDRAGEEHRTFGEMLESVSPVLLTLIGASILYGFGVAIGLVFLIVPGLILLTWWSVIAPVIVVERTGVIDAFRRSRSLVDGNGWLVFAVILVIFVITALVSLLLVVLFAIFGGFVGSLIGIFIAGVILKPIAALASPILYFDLREIEAEDRAAQGAPAPPRSRRPPARRPPAHPPPRCSTSPTRCRLPTTASARATASCAAAMAWASACSRPCSATPRSGAGSASPPTGSDTATSRPSCPGSAPAPASRRPRSRTRSRPVRPTTRSTPGSPRS